MAQGYPASQGYPQQGYPQQGYPPQYGGKQNLGLCTLDKQHLLRINTKYRDLRGNDI